MAKLLRLFRIYQKRKYYYFREDNNFYKFAPQLVQ